MKKQIALLATIIAASGFTAFGQDYITLGTSASKYVYDDFTTPGVGVVAGSEIDVIALWAPVGTADDLTSVGSQFGLNGEAATDQVATNGVTSVASANPLSDISTMLANGWSIASVVGSGSNIVMATEGVEGGKTGGQITPANGGTPVEISSSTVSSTGNTGGDIEMIFLAYNASAGSYLTATDLGWSNPFLNPIGTSAGDPNADQVQNGDALNAFGVAPVPEPATLVLAGLGGLSMLAFRRRKN